MPLHQTAEYDPVTFMTQVHTSAVFEMVISLQNLVDSWKMEDLANEVREILGDAFIEDSTDLHRSVSTCCAFAELAIDYEDRDDVDGFLSYVANMPIREFAFYLLGRWIPLENLPEVISQDSVRKLIDDHTDSECISQYYADISWTDGLSEMQKKLHAIWRDYWNGFFRYKIADLRGQWSRSINEKREYLDRAGARELLQQLTGKDELPDPMPEGFPVSRIEIIPVCYTSRPSYTFYGYGSVQILYDCSRTREREWEIEDFKRRSLLMLKALADENRLKILKEISQRERVMNGKALAEKLELSPSVISRHLSQLKEAGLIEEYSADNRNITYTFNIDRVRDLGGDIETFIHD